MIYFVAATPVDFKEELKYQTKSIYVALIKINIKYNHI